MHMHAKSDSEVTSLAPSSPTRSPRRPVYYVQSPSRDSHDGEKMSFQSTPILSPMGSPPHSSSSLGRHSRESSTSRFSGSLKPGSRKVQPHDGRHGKGKGWNQFSAIEEEGEFDESEEKKWPRRCYVLLFILCFAALFTVFSLILWGASRSFKPEVTVKSITFNDFYISAGSDATGVPTKMISINSTLRLSFYNPATFFGMHVTSTPLDLMYYQLAVASGQVHKFYQSKKSRRTVNVVLHGMLFSSVLFNFLARSQIGMATIQLHGHYRSLFTTNVMACFHEKEIDYEFVSVDLPTGAHKQPPFLALNPFGQVPVIKDGDFNLFESRAIIKYLAEKYEGQGSNLLGKTLRERAVVEQWSQVEAQTFIQPCTAILVQIVFAPMFGGNTDQAIVETNSEKLGKVLDVYEERLSKSDYLAGDFFSVADLSHLSFLNYLVNVAAKADLITSRKNVNAWWERISSRPAWKKVLEAIKS